VTLVADPVAVPVITVALADPVPVTVRVLAAIAAAVLGQLDERGGVLVNRDARGCRRQRGRA